MRVQAMGFYIVFQGSSRLPPSPGAIPDLSLKISRPTSYHTSLLYTIQHLQLTRAVPFVKWLPWRCGTMELLQIELSDELHFRQGLGDLRLMSIMFV